MLMTTTSPWRFASSTSVRWPSCRKPMVGTNAMRLPCARTASNACLRPRFVVSIFTGSVEGVFGVRIAAVAHGAYEAGHGCACVFCNRSEAPEKLGLEAVVQAEHVV